MRSGFEDFPPTAQAPTIAQPFPCQSSAGVGTTRLSDRKPTERGRSLVNRLPGLATWHNSSGSAPGALR